MGGQILRLVIQDPIISTTSGVSSFSSSARVFGRCVPRPLSSVMFSPERARQIIQQPRDQSVVGRGAGDVGENDGDAGRLANQLPQRRRAKGWSSAAINRRALVRQSRGMGVGSMTTLRSWGNSTSRPPLAIGQFDFHIRNGKAG